jgi:glycosyltransferase involved in cell wall biosynthesis
MNLYITADKIGTATGGGLVTHHESEALRELGPCEVWGRERLEGPGPDPWKWDNAANYRLLVHRKEEWPKLTHFYAGTFRDTIDTLQSHGGKITYTAAAHDVAASREEHTKLGLPYDYPHITDSALWQRYVGGYLAADVLIVPSQHSRSVMQGFGYDGRVEVIPHGVTLPGSPVLPLPQRFTVGYLGAIGPDKGLIYLLQAWKRLGYRDAVLKIAGRDSTSPFVVALVNHFGGGNIQLCGWQENVSDFYNSLSLYVQPSVTEGFGIEVLEAMAHGRPVVCSQGAGAVDTVPILGGICSARDADIIAYQIDNHYQQERWTQEALKNNVWREAVEQFTWDKIRARYQEVWRSLL